LSGRIIQVQCHLRKNYSTHIIGNENSDRYILNSSRLLHNFGSDFAEAPEPPVQIWGLLRDILRAPNWSKRLNWLLPFTDPRPSTQTGSDCASALSINSPFKYLKGTLRQPGSVRSPFWCNPQSISIESDRLDVGPVSARHISKLRLFSYV
jgi:hypothetical protein